MGRIKIFLTNLGKYNEGCLMGEWVKLPVPKDKLEAVLRRIGINDQYEEYFISDYESLFSNLHISEYTYHNTTIAPESVGMVTVATLPHNSPVRCMDLSIGVRPLWIPKTLTSPISRRYDMILFPFHADAPCEPHYSGHGEG